MAQPEPNRKSEDLHMSPRVDEPNRVARFYSAVRVEMMTGETR